MKKIIILSLLLVIFIFNINKVEAVNTYNNNYIVNENITIENPPVGDDLFSSIIGVVISLSVIIILSIYLKKQYKLEDYS